jgi:hypothetical protein
VFRRTKVDLTDSSVYDGGIPAKGPENANP